MRSILQWLCKPQRRRQRKWGKTKDASGRIMAQKVRFKTLCISKPSSAKQQHKITKCAWTEKGNPDGNCLSFHLELNAAHGKISSQPHAIVKQFCFPNGNVLFLSLFSLSKNWMHNVLWGCAEILPRSLTLRWSWV